jgi:hypothetical protein
MSRSGLIEIDAEPPPQRSQFDSEANFKKVIEEHRRYRTIRIRDEQHLLPETWEEKVEPTRTQRQQWAYDSFDMMKEALNHRPTRCLSEIFSDAYSIPPRSDTGRRGVVVERSCGGCLFCRSKGIQPFQGTTPAPRRIWQQPNYRLGDSIKSVLNGENLLGIFYPLTIDRPAERNRKSLIQRLVKEGIINIVMPQTLYPQLFNEQIVFRFESYNPFLMPQLPTLLYYDTARIPIADYHQFARSKVPLIIFMPDNTPDPTTPHRLVQDVWSSRGFQLDLICGELGV